MQISLSKASLGKGLKIFVLLTVVGFALVFFLTGTGRTITALNDFEFGYFLLAFGLTGVDLGCGSWRIFIFIRKIAEGVSFWDCFRANVANIFTAAVTPFQTGGGMAQVFVLNRAGATVAGAVSVSVINFVATLFMLLVAAAMIALFSQRGIPNLPFKFIVDFSSSAFLLASTFFVLFLFRPHVVSRQLERVMCLMGKLWPQRRHRWLGLSSKIGDFIAHYQGYIAWYWQHGKFLLLANLLLTVILYFNKCLIAFVVLRGMGLDPSLLSVISAQLLLIFLLYFSPTPGASLIAETSSAALMSFLIPNHLLSIFAVLWRFFTTHLGVALGAFVLVREIGGAVEDGAPHVGLAERVAMKE